MARMLDFGNYLKYFYEIIKLNHEINAHKKHIKTKYLKSQTLKKRLIVQHLGSTMRFRYLGDANKLSPQDPYTREAPYSELSTHINKSNINISSIKTGTIKLRYSYGFDLDMQHSWTMMVQYSYPQSLSTIRWSSYFLLKTWWP